MMDNTTATAPAPAPAPAAAPTPTPKQQPPPQPDTSAPAAATPDLGDVPLIFQCKSCRALVGDTTAWWCALKDQRPGFALFAQHRNVQVATLTVTPECTYRDMACVLCQAKLGQYIEVPPKDEPTLTKKYVYHLDCVSIAGLGGYVAEPEHEFCRASLSAVPAPAATSEELHLMTYGIKELNKKVDYIIAKYVSKSHARHKQRVEAAVLAAGSGATQLQQQQQNAVQQHPQSTSAATSRRSSAASITMPNGPTFTATATPSTLPPGTTLNRDQLSQFHARQSASSSAAQSNNRSAPRSTMSNGTSTSAMLPPLPPSAAAPPTGSSTHMPHHFAAAPATATLPFPPTTSLPPAAPAHPSDTLSYASIYNPSPTPAAAGNLNYIPASPFPGFPPGPSASAAAVAAAAAAGLTHQQVAASFLSQVARQQQMLAGMPPPIPATAGASAPGAPGSGSAGAVGQGPAAKRQKTGAVTALTTALGVGATSQE
ncbi:hypothetical protein BCR44DRAFT_1021120 [Catenaria anguillulae PL171]|uniref:Mis18 domain-containing protein n=1 Tax=Catenaria anguillulae PL171 TaxID=765915 RepID=A0A1Y2H689_9FUNG|nr:hypothetical protein BCR44DRAFT_1021120 [Catenaria anguillulae PL171]